MKSPWLLLGTVACLAACGEPRLDRPGAPGSPGGSGAVGAPGGGGSGPSFTVPGNRGGTGDAGMAPVTSNCGEETHTLDRLPPEIIVILDRSNTMRFPVGASPNSRLFDVAVALDDVVKQTQSKVFWGLRFFPTVQGCEVGDAMEVGLALDNHTVIAAALKAATPNNLNTGTPMQLAVRKAVGYLLGRGSANPGYIVLGTDGLPNCRDGNPGADDTEGTIAALAEARAAGVQTFVVGIAAGDAQSPSSKGLSAMAEAGGQPRPVEPKFYPVQDRSQLAQVLGDITVRAGSCVFPLSKLPPAPDRVSVRVSGMDVPKDPVNGWSLDAAAPAIVLNGSACQALQQSRIDIKVQVLFGCQID